jgi:hypothetical protein
MADAPNFVFLFSVQTPLDSGHCNANVSCNRATFAPCRAFKLPHRERGAAYVLGALNKMNLTFGTHPPGASSTGIFS